VWRLGPLPPPEGGREESTGDADECDGAGSLASRYRDVELRVTATDAEPDVLRRARRATYELGTLKELPTPWIREAFGAQDDGSESSLTLRPEFRKGVSFLRSDIRTSMPHGPFGFILCRNLAFTYFDTTLQRKTLLRLALHLRQAGLLVLGGHERLPEPHADLERLAPSLPLYRRRAPA